MQLTLYAGNSMVLRLEGLQDHNGEAVEGATVAAALERDGEALTGSPFALSPAATAGDYEVTLSDELAVTVGEWLDGEITAEAGGASASWTMRVGVRERR